MILAALVFVACAASDPEVTPDSIRALHDEGRFAETIGPLESMLRAKPGDPELNRLFGIALLKVERPSVAIWPLTRAAESPDADATVGLLLAKAHMEGGHADDAIAAADRVVERDPTMVDALYLRAQAKEAVKRYEEALEDTELIRDVEPDHGPALVKRLQLFLILEREEDAESAIEEMRKVVEAADEPEQWMGRMCAIDAVFTFERQGDDYLDRTLQLWDGCLENYPAHDVVVPAAIEFFDVQGDRDRATAILRRALEADPENLEYKIGLGERLASLGEHEEAEKLLRDAAQSSGNRSAWVVLITYYDKRDQLDKAVVALKQMLALSTEHSSLDRLRYADYLIRAGEFETAGEEIRLIEEPEFKALLEGRLLLATGKPKKALERLDEGIRLWPGNSVTRQLAAEAAEQLGDFDRAIEDYKEAVRSDINNIEALEKLVAYLQAMGGFDTINQIVGRYVSSNPGDPRGYRMLIESARKRGRPVAAADAIENLGQIPGHLPEAVATGASFRALADPQGALEYIERTGLDLTVPANNEVLAVLVDVLGKLDRQDVALARSSAALSAHPTFAAFHEIHAAALEAAGRPAADVRAALARAVELAPRRASALSELARLHGEVGKIDEAVRLYTSAGRAAPEETHARWAAIELLSAEGRDDEIDARARALLKAHPYHPQAATLVAERIMARGGNLDQAREFARRGARFGGGTPSVLTLGVIELARGDAETAVVVLRMAANAAPESPTIRYHLGRALSESGDAEGARAEFERALEGESFPQADAARAELARLTP